jgi:hypothetical protein
LGTAGDFSEGRFTLPCEQVFSLYRFDLQDKYTELFSGDGLYKGTKETTVKKELYGNTGSDIREMNLWNLFPRIVYKLHRNTFYNRSNYMQPNILPVIPISETFSFFSSSLLTFYFSLNSVSGKGKT